MQPFHKCSLLRPQSLTQISMHSKNYHPVKQRAWQTLHLQPVLLWIYKTAQCRLWRPASQATDPQGPPQLLLVTPCTLALPPADISSRRQSTATDYGLTLTPSPIASLTTIQDTAFTLPCTLNLIVRRAGDAPLKLVGVLLGATTPLFEVVLSSEFSLDVPTDKGSLGKLYQIPLPATLLQGLCQPASLTLVLTTNHAEATQQACTYASQLHCLNNSAPGDDLLEQLGHLDLTDPPICHTATILLLPRALAAEVYSIWQHKLNQALTAAAQFELEDDSLLMFSAASSSFESAHSELLTSPRIGSSANGAVTFQSTPASTSCAGLPYALEQTPFPILTDLQAQARLWQDEFSTFNTRFSTILHAKQTLLSATSMPEQAAAIALHCFPVVDDIMGQLLASQAEGVLLQHLPALVHQITQLLHAAVRQPLVSLCNSHATDGAATTPKLRSVGSKATGHRRDSTRYHTPPASPKRRQAALQGWPTPSYTTPFSTSATIPFPTPTPAPNPAAALLDSSVPDMPPLPSPPRAHLGTSLFATPPPPPPPATKSLPALSPADLLPACSATHTSSTVLSLPADLIEPVHFSGHGLADQMNTAPSVQKHRWELMTSGRTTSSPFQSPPASPHPSRSHSHSDTMMFASAASREANSPWIDTLLPPQRRV